MSVDIFIKKKRPISPAELAQTLQEISSEFSDINFIKTSPDTQDYDCIFWKAVKCYLDLSEEGEITLSSNSYFYPFIEFITYFLAKKLKATVFDPQAGRKLKDIHHNLEKLKRMHEEAVEYNKDFLKASYTSQPKSKWAANISTTQFLTNLHLAVEKGAKQFLTMGKIEPHATSTKKTPNYVRFIPLSFIRKVLITCYTAVGNAIVPENQITIRVSAPADLGQPLDDFISFLSEELGTTFTKRKEY